MKIPFEQTALSNSYHCKNILADTHNLMKTSVDNLVKAGTDPLMINLFQDEVDNIAAYKASIGEAERYDNVEAIEANWNEVYSRTEKLLILFTSPKSPVVSEDRDALKAQIATLREAISNCSALNVRTTPTTSRKL